MMMRSILGVSACRGRVDAVKLDEFRQSRGVQELVFDVAGACGH